MISTLYNDSESVLTWLRHAPAAWKQWILESQYDELKTLRTNKDQIELARSQGKLEFLDRVIGLEEELNGLGKKG